MNTRHLRELGVRDECMPAAIGCLQAVAPLRKYTGRELKQAVARVVACPDDFVEDADFGPLARALVEAGTVEPVKQIDYPTWGEQIDDAAHAQMRQACRLPVAVAAALMPDAHVGYGLPIGGVLALEGAVAPYAVGVDIACRMRLSILDLPSDLIDKKGDMLAGALERGTRFGVGSEHERPQDHAVLDQDWNVTRITREHKDKARRQLGTSGSGNHFVEFGELTLDTAAPELGLEAGRYLALLSHSGSRGSGAAVCDTYANIARVRLPKRYEEAGRLAWLALDSHEGQEYWAAMNLMGDYAAANHEVIHRLVNKLAGAHTIAVVENHHNFAWKETHGGRELVVHRKGATPAAEGELGVIPGSMADPAFVVVGRGKAESLNSASHGAGRRMSRTAARDKFRWNAVRNELAAKGVRVLSAGADEVPYAYKRIEDVMRDQHDLVRVLARFDPRIVKMCGDGSKAED